MLNEAECRANLLALPTPTIVIDDDITRKVFEQVAGCMLHLIGKKSPPIKIIINSPGGEVDSGLDIYDLLRLYEGEKTGIVIDRAASMGAVILQACNVRACARHASILIHHVSRSNITLDQLRNPRKLKEVRDSMEKSQAKLYAILTDRTGQSVSRIRTVCALDKHMSAREALKFGLIDKIV
ncbi:MAG: ATP-dependent Clp protease proteolytic subunit [Candidatus Pacebacteria bacterium]|nr:ATP-dependent Clp protease proteolytic subunit [Candidatus Paceibacterota bacterium]